MPTLSEIMSMSSPSIGSSQDELRSAKLILGNLGFAAAENTLWTCIVRQLILSYNH